MKQLVLILASALALATATPALAQTPGVGIGTTAPDASAALDIVSSAKGALLPRHTAAQRLAIATPAPGLIVFQTDSPTSGTGSGTNAGFWYNAGSSSTPNWLRLADSGAVSYDPSTGLQVGPGTVSSTNTGSNVPGSAPGYNGPFRGDVLSARTETIYPAAYLTALGLQPGPLTAISYRISTKYSTLPYQNFTVALGLSQATTLTTNFTASGLTPVYSGTVTTPSDGQTITLPFNGSSFSWDGTSSIIVQTCFLNTGASAADEVYGDGAANSRIFAAAGSSQCAAPSGSGSGNRPAVAFAQPGPYALPASAGLAGQVLTQQANGQVAFKDPQWLQTGTTLYPSDNTVNTVRVGQEVNSSTYPAVGSGLEMANPAVSTDVLGLYRANVAANQSELRAVVGDDPYGGTNSDRFVVGTVNSSTAGTLLTGAFTPQLTVLSNGSLGIGVTPQNRFDVQLQGRTGTHPTGRPFYVTGDVGQGDTGFEFRHSNGTQGIGIGYNSLYATGSNTNQNLNLLPLGTGGVGIGTTNPLSRVSITPNATEPKLTLWDGGNSANHYGFGVSGYQLNYHVDSPAANHVFWAGGKNGDGTELMRVAGNGFVGIGTVPVGRLHVVNNNGGSGGADDYVFDEYGPGDQGIYLRRAGGTMAAPTDLTNGEHIGRISFVPRVGGNLGYTNGSTIQSYYRGDGNSSLTDLQFYTTATERMRISENGNIGIGTTSPQAKLDILGGADNNGGNDLVALAFQWHGSGYRHFLRSRHNGGLGGGGNDLDFYLNNSSTAAGSSAPGTGNVQVMTLENNNGTARVGVGTSGPAYALDVVGDLNSSNALRLNGAATAYRSDLNYFLATTYLPATAPTGTANLMVGWNSGQLLTTGYNNATLGYLAGDALTTGNSNVFVGIQAGGATNAGSDNVFIGHDPGYSNVSGNGNVGIGRNGLFSTTADNNTALGTFAGDGVTTGTGNTLLGYGADLSGTQRNRATALGYNAKVDQDDGVVLGDPGSNASKVGIGTATPAAKLTVQPLSDGEVGLRVTNGVADGTSASSNITLQPLTGGNSGFAFLGFNGFYSGSEGRYNTSKNRWRVGTDQRGSSDAFFVDTYNGTTSATVLTATTSGNVGIGTTPNAKLDVNGSTKLGTNGTAFNAVIRAAATQTVGTIAANNAVTVTFTIANVVSGGTAYVSPSNDLANGISISYARTANGSVIAKFYNATGGPITVGSNTYNITVVQ